MFSFLSPFYFSLALKLSLLTVLLSFLQLFFFYMYVNLNACKCQTSLVFALRITKLSKNLEQLEKIELFSLQIAEQQLGMGIGKRSRGILITSLQPGSAAAEKLKVGDRLLAVNAQPVTDQVSLRYLLGKERRDYDRDTNRFESITIEENSSFNRKNKISMNI